MNANDLTLRIYRSGMTEVEDTDGSLKTAHIESFGTIYPGGLFSTCRVFVAREVTRGWAVKENMRVAIFNGLRMVWEGKIAEMGYAVQGTEEGNTLECVGQWGSLLGRRYINKIWADIRLSEAAWVRQPQGDNDSFANIDRLNRISVGPQARAWAANDIVAAFRYTMPTGETIKRIKATLNNREAGGQDWITRMRDVIGSATLFSETGDGVTTATDHTLATPRQYVEFQFMSNANQTPTNAYGRMTAVTVYSETGNITPTSVVKSVRARYSEINSDETQIASNTFTLEPFATNGCEAANAVLLRAAGFGDASFNAWACYFEASETAVTPDGKPVLCFQPQPALTDYDYSVRLDEENLVGRVELKRAIVGEVFNWIVARYRDELNNRDVLITPDDDANLKDQDSIDTYGQLELVVDAGTATATSATNYGRRVLSAKKNAQFKMTGPLTVRGSIRTKAGTLVPACQISAGKRVRLENFLADLSDVLGAGLTFIITSTEYRPEDETISMTCGRSDNLAVYLAQRALLDNRRVV
jgi:hypothetical protein